MPIKNCFVEGRFISFRTPITSLAEGGRASKLLKPPGGSEVLSFALTLVTDHSSLSPVHSFSILFKPHSILQLQ